MMAIRSVPQAPLFVKGVINLRGNVIPVMDLRLRFDMEEVEYNDRTCIIVLEQEVNGKNRLKGIAVDSVSEVLAIKASEIEDAPTFGMGIDTDYILAVAKIENGVKILLDIDNVLGDTEPRSRAPLKVSV
jgi:purine-binding chemotaxis protein CheW